MAVKHCGVIGRNVSFLWCFVRTLRGEFINTDKEGDVR